MEIISTELAPAAIGPYSQAIKVNNMVYTSGQIPLDPATMEITPGGIAEQTQQVMENIKAVLEEAGVSLGQVVKATCFLSDMNNFTEFNTIYAQYFSEQPPARSCVEVARLPKDVLVEVEVVAVI